MDYITTYTGKHFRPLNPEAEHIDIIDIAHALSLCCRGNGHVKSFFSVASHCINCSLEAKERGYDKKLILACLLHDASEAYMSDVPRPFKQFLKDYNAMENKLLNVIYTKYLGSTLTKDEAILIKQIDDDLLYYDLKYLLNEEVGTAPKINIHLNYNFVSFEEVEKKYLDLYEKFRLF
ncbi:hypothetical protein SAMN05216249_10321 [Acetitomaculum ruminis DSM 5522]|uniref:HD domain-containing protein n=1 Tax=Acetitomaculum ruminis DSM 5522 TaxID=1120918 RepID=A0A1I0W2C5_9FIRM|nr:hypothetical protein [Acetitomaculum ruminis]SFA82487.1 hypothetical protein SAMN05216249_10321 [Acetitomaculum ruminis DSM 5522]